MIVNWFVSPQPAAAEASRQGWLGAAIPSGGGTTIILDGLLATEFLATQRRDTSANAESLSRLSFDRTASIEFTALQTLDRTTPLEFLSVQTIDRSVLAETLGAIQRDVTGQIENLLIQLVDKVSFVEILATQAVDRRISIENLATVFRDVFVPNDVLSTSTNNGFIPLEWLGLVSVIKDGVAPLEFGSQLIIQNSSPIEINTLLFIERLIGIEFLHTLSVDKTVTIETLAKIFTDSSIPTETLSIILAVITNGVIPLEWSELLVLLKFALLKNEQLSASGVKGESLKSITNTTGENIE